MSRYRLNRKAARRKKSMKMGAGDLQEMIKDAVKAALAEEKEGDDPEEDKDDDDIADIVSDAIDSINEKRKSAKEDEIGEDAAAEIVEAIVDAADGTKGDEVDLETVIQDALDNVNEKRKSRKEDELGDGFADELLDAVAEVMSDDEPEDDEEKGMKGTTPTRQKKSAGTLQKRREPARKYSNIYMSRKGEACSRKRFRHISRWHVPSSA